MTHAPMTYVFRSYEGDSEVYGKYAVYFCNKNGERATLTFDSSKVAKAFTTALDGLGFTKKRR